MNLPLEILTFDSEVCKLRSLKESATPSFVTGCGSGVKGNDPRQGILKHEGHLRGMGLLITDRWQWVAAANESEVAKKRTAILVREINWLERRS